jgi:hypothetical protein
MPAFTSCRMSRACLGLATPARSHAVRGHASSHIVSHFCAGQSRRDVLFKFILLPVPRARARTIQPRIHIRIHVRVPGSRLSLSRVY